MRSGQQAARPAAPKPQRRHAAVAVPDGAPVTEVLPPDGVSYPQVLRGRSYAPGRSIAGVVIGLSMYLLLVTLVSQIVILLGWALTAAAVPYVDYAREAAAYQRPVGMLGVNLGIATLIPIACLLVLVLHRVRPRWLVSVQPGIRWRYLLVSLVIALVSLNGVLLLSQVVTGTLPTLSARPGFWGFMVVVVVTSPIQAAAEELFFRGYLMQALGSLVARPWFGVVVSSVLFALLHGSQNLALFVNRLVFGLLAAVLVWKTGGLEAGIAAHAVNNVFAYLFAGLTTGIATLKTVQSLTWGQSAVGVGSFALFAALAYLAFRFLRLRSTVDLGLHAPRADDGPGGPSGLGARPSLQ